MARKIYRVVPNGGLWSVTHAGQTLSNHATKPPAVSAGQQVAKGNERSQLMVHRGDGTFEYEYTYGDDPYPPIG